VTEKPVAADVDFRLYEKTARQYDRVRFSGLAGSWGHRRQIEILRSFCPDWRGKKVLEIGCGTGRITESLARWGARVTATDISREMLEVARDRLRSLADLPTPEFRVMSVFECDLDLRAYDFIVMVNVLGRLSDPARAIREIASRMGGQGTLIFSFPCLTSVLLPAALVVNLRGRSLTRDVTSRWYAPKTIREYCSDAGLEIVGFRGNHYVPVPRLLFATLPFFWACDKMIGGLAPWRCPSVFVECRINQHG
jgi:2-polyprenyl-3-methyl-5-hydroxy-6-metoxy-1,4-benzoquinol methylase